MKIGVHDGSIVFERGTIHRTDERESFLATELGRTATTKLVNREWWHVDVKPESGIAVRLIFQDNRLHSVYVLHELPSDRNGEWTVERELERRAVHDRWLRKELGEPPYEFDWGVVASEFDGKAVVSEIIVAYDR